MIRRMWRAALLPMIMTALLLGAAAAPMGTITVQTKGGTVALYRVGDFEQTHFRLLESYGGGKLTFDESLSPEVAARLLQYARNGYVKAGDIHGTVEFTQQEAGLYLVVQRSAPQGYEPFAPFLVSLPWDGDQWEVKAEPKLESAQPSTGDRSKPERWLATMCFSAAGIVWCLWYGWEELRKV